MLSAGALSDRAQSALNRLRRSKKEVDAKGFTLMTLPYLQEVAKEQKGYHTPALNDNLYLHYKGFARISDAICAYDGLKSLWLEGNALSSIEHLDALKLLRCLYLQENCIESLAGVARIQSLAILNVSNNLLTALPAELADLPHLSSLHATNNKFKSAADIAVLRDCTALTVLDLHHNAIDDRAAVTDVIWHIPNLAVLTLHHNPVLQSLAQYRRNTIVQIQSLTYLDDRPVFDNERRATEAWAAGGIDAERAEQQRQRDAERDEQRRNFDALAALQAQNREKRRAAGEDVDAPMTFAPHLQKFHDDMVAKGLAEDASEDDDDAAAEDQVSDLDDEDAPPSLESVRPPPTSSASEFDGGVRINPAVPVRAAGTMDVAGTQVEPPRVSAPAVPMVAPTTAAAKVQEIDDTESTTAPLISEAKDDDEPFVPLAQLLSDAERDEERRRPRFEEIEDEDNKVVEIDTSKVASITSLLGTASADKLDDEESAPLLGASDSAPSRRPLIEEVIETIPLVETAAPPAPIIAPAPVHAAPATSAWSAPGDPFQIRAFRKLQETERADDSSVPPSPAIPATPHSTPVPVSATPSVAVSPAPSADSRTSTATATSATGSLAAASSSRICTTDRAEMTVSPTPSDASDASLIRPQDRFNDDFDELEGEDDDGDGEVSEDPDSPLTLGDGDEAADGENPWAGPSAPHPTPTSEAFPPVCTTTAAADSGVPAPPTPVRRGSRLRIEIGEALERASAAAAEDSVHASLTSPVTSSAPHRRNRKGLRLLPNIAGGMPQQQSPATSTAAAAAAALLAGTAVGSPSEDTGPVAVDHLHGFVPPMTPTMDMTPAAPHSTPVSSHAGTPAPPMPCPMTPTSESLPRAPHSTPVAGIRAGSDRAPIAAPVPVPVCPMTPTIDPTPRPPFSTPVSATRPFGDAGIVCPMTPTVDTTPRAPFSTPVAGTTAARQQWTAPAEMPMTPTSEAMPRAPFSTPVAPQRGAGPAAVGAGEEDAAVAALQRVFNQRAMAAAAATRVPDSDDEEDEEDDGLETVEVREVRKSTAAAPAPAPSAQRDGGDADPGAAWV
ncbi:hypothetical protein H9P43_001966 [Blastocladiella emersonii ATCC 22665]|nr:hypothetical protein H9P43_001966 [Blastocladiella emersonii ATCC 22665]